VWADARNADGTCPLHNADRGEANIYFTRSTDGRTWLPPRAIASEPVDEFFPSVFADPYGFVRVLYYKRTAQNARRFSVYEIFSGDWGNTFSAPVRINDSEDIVEATQGPDFIGDYITIEGTPDSNGTRHAAWYDSRRLDPVRGGPQGDIYTAKMSGC
jgi:hypothetical protein